MSSNDELIECWNRLDITELQAIATMAQNPKTAQHSMKLQHFLANSLNAEADFREEFKVKKHPQFPNVADWADVQIADGYRCSLVIEKACSALSQTLQEWAELLRTVLCNEMAARLTGRQILKEVDPCRN